MPRNVLYFPYVSVPDSAWTIKSFLYWDKIYTIDPNNYDRATLLSDDLTSKLLESKAITALPPKTSEGFTESAKEIIAANSATLDDRRQWFSHGYQVKVHKDKWSYDLFEHLVRLGLAEEKNDENWTYHVETDTAWMIMLYLAQDMSKANDALPSTDQVMGFSPSGFQLPEGAFEMRNEFLNQVLPFPKNPNWESLHEFKQEYEKELIRFRSEIESAINSTIAVPAGESREAVKRDHVRRIHQRTGELLGMMEKIKDDKNSKAALEVGSLIVSTALSGPGPLIKTGVDKVLNRMRPEGVAEPLRIHPMYYVAHLHNQFG